MPAGRASRAAWAALAVLFALSVALRLPGLARPLGAPHDWLTATVLIHQQLWAERGALRHNFGPMLTFSNPGDRHINNFASFQDAAGVYYYTSYPPLAYALPYVLFRAAGVRPEVLPLRVFNLGVHLACCVFLFLIVRGLTRAAGPAADWLGLAAAAVYLFAPRALWFHANVYMADMLVQAFFLAGIWLGARIFRENSFGAGRLALLGLIAFLMVYTEWLGVFFALAVGLRVAVEPRRKELRAALYAVAAGAALALALTFWQYSSIAGTEAFVRSSLEKYLWRSGYAEPADHGRHVWDLAAWRMLLVHYGRVWGPFLFAAAALTGWAWAARGWRLLPEALGAPEARAALWLALAPVALHHLVFFNFTSEHEFSALKAGPGLAIWCGLMGRAIVEAPPAAARRQAAGLAGLLALAAAASALLYLRVVRTADGRYLAMGRQIAAAARPDEVIFVEDGERAIVPQLVFHARRNLAPWKGAEDARRLMRLNGAAAGAVFALDESGCRVTETRRVTPDRQ